MRYSLALFLLLWACGTDISPKTEVAEDGGLPQAGQGGSGDSPDSGISNQAGSSAAGSGGQLAAGSGAAGSPVAGGPAAGSGGIGGTGGSGGSIASECPAKEPMNRVTVLAAAGQASSIVGLQIQGSNVGPTLSFVTLATITSAAEGQTVELVFNNTTAYRYLRVFAPVGSQGSLAEVGFYHDALRLTGTPFGTAGSTPAATQDGDPNTTSTIQESGGGYLGVDIGHLTQTPTFSPLPGSSVDPVQVSLSGMGTILYSIDGSDPTLPYTTPIAITATTTVRAVATTECTLPSVTAVGTYTIGQAPVTGGLNTYHLGNSLTDTINPWLKPIADSTGVTHTYARWTIPGAPIKWLLEHKGDGFGTPAEAANFDTYVQTAAPIGNLVFQPYSDPVFADQVSAAANLAQTATASNPGLQVWLYSQWAETQNWNEQGMSVGWAYNGDSWYPTQAPTDWESATINQVEYTEEFGRRLAAQIGRPVKVIPSGNALVGLKRAMAAGTVPDMSGDFFAAHFEDGVHLKAQAQYMVALAVYATMYRKSPVGVTHEGTGLTAAQATVFQQIAWDTMSVYVQKP